MGLDIRTGRTGTETPSQKRCNAAAARSKLDAGGGMWSIDCCPACGAELEYEEHVYDDGTGHAWWWLGRLRVGFEQRGRITDDRGK